MKATFLLLLLVVFVANLLLKRGLVRAHGLHPVDTQGVREGECRIYGEKFTRLKERNQKMLRLRGDDCIPETPEEPKKSMRHWLLEWKSWKKKMQHY